MSYNTRADQSGETNYECLQRSLGVGARGGIKVTVISDKQKLNGKSKEVKFGNYEIKPGVLQHSGKSI